MSSSSNIYLTLRLPQRLANVVHQRLKSEEDSDTSSLSFQPAVDGDKTSDYVFTFDDQTYPALLVNLPAPVEVHKTADNKLLTKTADVAQMLHVFETVDELRVVRDKVSKSKTPFGDALPSGLTPPTFDIVHRRFDQTRVVGDFLPYKIRTVIVEINQFIAQSQTRQFEVNLEDESKTTERLIEVEEIVEFEDWMLDPQNPGQGRVITFDGTDEWSADCELLGHFPEQLLVTDEEREEDELERLAKERLKAETSTTEEAKKEQVELRRAEEEEEEAEELELDVDEEEANDNGESANVNEEAPPMEETEDAEANGMAWLDSDEDD